MKLRYPAEILSCFFQVLTERPEAFRKHVQVIYMFKWMYFRKLWQLVFSFCNLNQKKLASFIKRTNSKNCFIVL